MKWKILLISFLLTLSATIYSQNLMSDSVVKQPKTIFRLSLLAPGFEVEKTIAKNKTIVFSLWSAFSYFYSNTTHGSNYSLTLYPGCTVNPRFYTNLEERAKEGKTSEFYSGTYIGIPLSLIVIKDPCTSGGLEAGFQKKLGKSGFWDASFGMGLQSYHRQTRFTLLGNIKLGFILK